MPPWLRSVTHLNLEQVVSTPGASHNIYVNEHNLRSSSPGLNVECLLQVHVFKCTVLRQSGCLGEGVDLWDTGPYLGLTGPWVLPGPTTDLNSSFLVDHWTISKLPWPSGVTHRSQSHHPGTVS